MAYRTGHNPDPPDVEARRPKFHLHPDAGKLRGSALPLSTRNRLFVPESAGGPGIQNQGQVGACEGFTHSSVVTTDSAIRRAPIPRVSAIGWYQGALKLQRQPLPNGNLPMLSDDGTEPSLIAQAGQLFGVASEKSYGLMPPDPATVIIDPNVAKEELEYNFHLDGTYFLDSTNDQKCLDIMSFLAVGTLLSDALPASGPEFQGYTGGILGALSGPIDHAGWFVDYDWDGSNLDSLVLWKVNSWGDQWGEADSLSGLPGGFFRVNRQYVAQCADVRVMKLRYTGVIA